MLWTDGNPQSPSTCGDQVKEVEELGVKLSLGRREGWGEGGFSCGFISHYSTLLLIGIKLIYPSLNCFARNDNW